MTTNSELMNKLDSIEKKIQEQSKKIDELILLCINKQTPWKDIKNLSHVEKVFNHQVEVGYLSENNFTEFYKGWKQADKERLERMLSKFPNNPLSQPEPCEETKIKLFGNQDIKSI